MKTKAVRIILMTALASAMLGGCSSRDVPAKSEESVTVTEPVIKIDPITPGFL